MSFWPGLDQWPPPRRVWIAAAVLAFVITPLLMLTGIVGQIIIGIAVIFGIALSLWARLRQMNERAEEFWRSGPED